MDRARLFYAMGADSWEAVEPLAWEQDGPERVSVSLRLDLAVPLNAPNGVTNGLQFYVSVGQAF